MFGASLTPNPDAQYSTHAFKETGAMLSGPSNLGAFDPSLVQALRQSLIQFNSQTGVVTINGTTERDNALVTRVSGNRIRVQLIDVESHLFDLPAVTRVDFFGRDGDDSFNNFTQITSRAFGHGGDDRLRGGSSRDELFGGPGQDQLQGMEGNDKLAGHEGNDLILGGQGDDQAMGGDGNDRILGENGADQLNGDAGNDVVIGGLKSDIIRGGSGNDDLEGSEGNDRLFGDGGDDRLLGGNGDDLLWGGVANDRILGGAGQDRAYGESGFDVLEGQDGADMLDGGAGDDELNGGAGRDTLIGDIGNDLLRGQADADVLEGGNGNDELIGNDGNDRLLGGKGDDRLQGSDGDDRLFGNFGNDTLWGGRGRDQLFGMNGDDNLYGESGADLLDGGNGNDGLFGGNRNSRDSLRGGSGSDRFLTQTNDRIIDRSNADARVRFINRSSGWSDAEIEVVDQGLRQLHLRTRNPVLLEDKLSGYDLEFVKVRSLGGVAAAQNVLRTFTTTRRDSSGRVTTTTRYEREIQVANWDLNDEFRNSVQPSLIIHEIGHNWDSVLEINAQLGQSGHLWNKFLERSNWSRNRRNSNYVLSGDRQWWYNASIASFARGFGRFSPEEDWSTVWEKYFEDGGPNNTPNGNLRSKLVLIDRLFELAE